MSRIASAHNQSSRHRRSAGQFGEADDVGQPIDSFETLVDGGVQMSVALDSAPISSGDLDADVVDRTDDRRTRRASPQPLSPERFARLRLSVAFSRG